jgi:hypothetical protein
MNCLFCQQPVQTVKTTNGAPCEEGATLISYRYCAACQTRYHQTYHYFIYQNFSIFFFYSGINAATPLFRIWDNAYGKDKLVLDLNFWPTITPQNVAIRLPLLLAFL